MPINGVSSKRFSSKAAASQLLPKTGSLHTSAIRTCRSHPPEHPETQVSDILNPYHLNSHAPSCAHPKQAQGTAEIRRFRPLWAEGHIGNIRGRVQGLMKANGAHGVLHPYSTASSTTDSYRKRWLLLLSRDSGVRYSRCSCSDTCSNLPQTMQKWPDTCLEKMPLATLR